jgi:hypothetical protein
MEGVDGGGSGERLERSPLGRKGRKRPSCSSSHQPPPTSACSRSLRRTHEWTERGWSSGALCAGAERECEGHAASVVQSWLKQSRCLSSRSDVVNLTRSGQRNPESIGIPRERPAADGALEARSIGAAEGPDRERRALILRAGLFGRVSRSRPSTRAQ